MVLPNSSADSSTPSDQSTYDFSPSPSDNEAPQTQLQIDTTSLPQPVPLLGRALSLTPARALQLTAFQLADLQRLTHRPPRPAEAQALTEASFRGVQLMSQSAALGLFGGLARAQLKRDPFRYPFPLGLFGRLGHVDPDAARVPLWGTLKGPAARTWHRALITGGHALNWLVLWGAAGVLVGAGQMTVLQTTDPRLKDYHAAKEREARESVQRMRRGRHGLPESQPGAARGPQRRPSGGAVGGQSGDNVPADDASATGRRGMADEQYAAYQEPFRAEDARPKPWEQERPAPEDRAYPMRPSRRPAPAPPGRTPPPAQDETPSDSVFGDATSASDGAASEGSAWDRLRRSASSQDPSSTPSGTPSARQFPRQRQAPGGDEDQGSRKGEDYSFSSAEQDKQLAKEQAQKDFDMMVDRERRGEDFEGGRGKRW